MKVLVKSKKARKDDKKVKVVTMANVALCCRGSM